MNRRVEGATRDAGATAGTAALTLALDQTELVQEKVEECAAELSLLNMACQQELADSPPSPCIELAIHQSDAVQLKVQACVDELATINDVLTEEIEERKDLEHELSITNNALQKSRIQEKRARHIAMHDAVTGLPTLTLFQDRLQNAIEQARRHEWRLAVMFIDLDGFKSINDTHGHDIGDQLLKLVARRLRTAVRGGDTVCRRSGDEFLILMLEAKSEANAANFAEKIIAHVAQPCELDGLALTIRFSVGIAICPDDAQTPADLLKQADIAMYTAKRLKHSPVLFSQVAA